MESIDDLLASLKAEYTNPPPSSSASPPAAQGAPSPLSLDPEEQDPLIAELKAEYEGGKSPAIKPATPSLPDIFPLETVYESPPPPSIFSAPPVAADTALVNELKAEMAAEAEAAQRRQQEALQEAQRRQKEALTKQAKAWLKQLKPNSEEGRWFQEFSEGYSSPLEAAIDYLQALQEVQSPELKFQAWEQGP